MSDHTVILVLGVGDTLMRDEGFGVAAAEEVERWVPSWIRVAPVGMIGPTTVSLLHGVTHLLVLDAVDAGLSPGTILTLAEPPSPIPTARATIHAFSVGDLLVLARHQGSVPTEVALVGAQVGELVPGVGLSPALEAAIEPAREEALRILSAWGMEPLEIGSGG
jgi:hydrogenase maturation protease